MMFHHNVFTFDSIFTLEKDMISGSHSGVQVILNQFQYFYLKLRP